ncbi:hypothetical protein BJX70DRAFT_399383 [Aspergillus crustosus]
MNIRALFLSMALMAVAGAAALDSTGGNTATSEVDSRGCPAGCMDYKDCCADDFCIAGACIVGHKVREAVKARDLDTAYLVSENEDDYDFYHFVTDANGKKKKKGTNNCCPKKCGNGVHCCKHDFCQLGECRGDHQP